MINLVFSLHLCENVSRIFPSNLLKKYTFIPTLLTTQVFSTIFFYVSQVFPQRLLCLHLLASLPREIPSQLTNK